MSFLEKLHTLKYQTDYTIISQQEKWHVHLQVLASKSSFFTEFSELMKKQVELKHDELNSPILNQFIKFCYLEQIDQEYFNNIKLWSLANYFGCRSLADFIDNHCGNSFHNLDSLDIVQQFLPILKIDLDKDHVIELFIQRKTSMLSKTIIWMYHNLQELIQSYLAFHFL